MWGGGRGCQGAARAGWTGRERSGVGGRGGSARGRLCTSPRGRGGRDLNARADGKKRPAEGWRRRGVRADGRTRTRARGGGSGRAARPRRPRRPRTRRRAPRTSGPARRRRRASRVRRTLRGGGGAPGEAPGAPFFSRSRAEASAAGTRLVVRVVGPGREERAARDAVGARVRGHGRNARLEEWARRVARNRRLSNHDRKNLPPRKWTRRPRREKAARVASASLRPVQGKRPRSRRRHSPHSPRRHHVARTREDARRGGARG